MTVTEGTPAPDSSEPGTGGNDAITFGGTRTLAERVNLRIRLVVRERGVTQRWIAQQINLSQPQVWERLSGYVDWRLVEIDTLAAALNIDPLELLAPSAK